MEIELSQVTMLTFCSLALLNASSMDSICTSEYFLAIACIYTRSALVLKIFGDVLNGHQTVSWHCPVYTLDTPAILCFHSSPSSRLDSLLNVATYWLIRTLCIEFKFVGTVNAHSSFAWRFPPHFYLVACPNRMSSTLTASWKALDLPSVSLSCVTSCAPLIWISTSAWP